MNIVILTSYFHPEITGIAPHATAIARALHGRGHAVTVFTPQPHYPEWQVHAEYRGRRSPSEDMAGITVHRSRIWLPRKDSVTLKTRLVGEGSAVAFQGMKLLRHLPTVARADIVIVMSPFFAQAITALALRAALRRDFVFHVEDIIPDSALDTGVLDRSGGLARALVSFAGALERRVYRSARCVSTLTSAMRDNIQAKAPNAKVVMAGYWIDPAEHLPDEALGAEFRAAHGYDASHLVIGYAGNIGAKQKLHALIDTAATFAERDDRVQFAIAGDGAHRSALEASVAASRLTNVRLLPLQRGREYSAFLNGVDLSYIAQADGVSDAFIPSKLYPTLASGCAVACFANERAELYGLMRESGAALTYTWAETDRFVSRVLDLAEDRSELQAMGAAARDFALARFTEESALAEFVCAVEGGNGV
ncbi:glycosyltransferase [Candidatus Poribacteria bacterium]|jgi:colanic acid biosynthesis glycosyl transferase WcaI|nr:glycosyltransferase [Candidatus Poribacteria bacterium]MBT5711906.1 glycosyltransferase [Candidatus Poribacteria bacterium]MBT7099148.1 glycosyltransferase [Candidatus Poribacteria bacterium]MBT7807316.1 glycosyltransferase [Candidatus Poribacteria bacterium]